jgi:hypothetical protein
MAKVANSLVFDLDRVRTGCMPTALFCAVQQSRILVFVRMLASPK